jgi:carbohydrate-binding DOMON domain-containing protein
VLSHDEIIRINQDAAPVLEADDPPYDDRGDAQYVYPGSPQFVAGSFDLRRLTVRCDSSRVYFSLAFRALSNPGWHPEYGFQLTFAAIALDQDGTDGSGATAVGRNAHASVGQDHAYEKIIFVGGGIRVEDASGKILAAYIPVEKDAADPFGNATTGTIQFALPIAIIGTPTDRWTCTVLSGAQDDHGGSGLGEFRSVNRERSEWNGGGRRRPDDPNVYDTMIVQRKR